MQCYSIPVPSLNTAQQYAETAGSLAEALHNLFLRRPCVRSDPSDPGAQAAYYRAVGAWYMENYDLIAAALMACHLLTEGAALELENVREAAESPAEPPSSPADGANAAGDIYLPCLNPETAKMPPALRYPQTREKIRKPPAGFCSIGRALQNGRTSSRNPPANRKAAPQPARGSEPP